MSVSYNTFIGPYIKVYNPEKDSFKEYYGCPNSKCHSYNKESSKKFCQDCGENIKMLKVPSKERINFNIYEEFKKENLVEILSEYKPDEVEDYNFYINNLRGGPGKNYDLNTDTFIEDINSIKIKDAIFVMRTNFTKEIARMKEVFGESNVTIHWGVIGYTS